MYHKIKFTNLVQTKYKYIRKDGTYYYKVRKYQNRIIYLDDTVWKYKEHRKLLAHFPDYLLINYVSYLLPGYRTTTSTKIIRYDRT